MTAGSCPPPVVPRGEDPSTGQDERRARILWSLIAEPEDPVALLARERLGPVRARTMMLEATAAEAIAALGEDGPSGTDLRRMAAALQRWRARMHGVDVDAVLERAGRAGIRVLVPGDPQWPGALADLRETAPHCLWIRGPGDLAHLTSAGPTIAMVGSRASTVYGEDCAGSLAAAIARREGCVVSGGAYGIDAAAHRGALAAGIGSTVAVLAGGLDALYPRGNTRLLEAIGTRHVLVSEAPPGTAPTRWRFLARNRLIAALADAVVVVEASWRSGALSTARHAEELSRPVGAVPGPVTSAASAGCHRLVRDRGAVLVTEGAHVLDLVRGGPAAGEDTSEHARQDELDLLSPADRRVLDGIPPRSGITTAELALVCAREQDVVRASLARLELLGLVDRSGAAVRRARARRGRPR